MIKPKKKKKLQKTQWLHEQTINTCFSILDHKNIPAYDWETDIDERKPKPKL